MTAIKTIQAFAESFQRAPLYNTGFAFVWEESQIRNASTNEQVVRALAYVKGYAACTVLVSKRDGDKATAETAENVRMCAARLIAELTYFDSPKGDRIAGVVARYTEGLSIGEVIGNVASGKKRQHYLKYGDGPDPCPACGKDRSTMSPQVRSFHPVAC